MDSKTILRLKQIGIVLIVALVMIPAGVFAHGHGKNGLSCQDMTSLRMGRVNIVSATEVAESGDVPAYCEVKGVIDKEINFTLLLPTPTDWNGKLIMGGGGFVTGVSNSAMSPSPFGNAIQRGYATSGTDTGHPGDVFGMTWAYQNKKRQLNFAYEFSLFVYLNLLFELLRG